MPVGFLHVRKIHDGDFRRDRRGIGCDNRFRFRGGRGQNRRRFDGRLRRFRGIENRCRGRRQNRRIAASAAASAAAGRRRDSRSFRPVGIEDRVLSDHCVKVKRRVAALEIPSGKAGQTPCRGSGIPSDCISPPCCSAWGFPAHGALPLPTPW